MITCLYLLRKIKNRELKIFWFNTVNTLLTTVAVLWQSEKKWSHGVVKQYRSLENQGAETRKDDILRAAVCAFVALTQPSKRDCNQIEDLALSILPYTSEATKRFVAAALSHSKDAPNALVKRLCEEPSDICAPLLLKSPVLQTVDLVLLAGTKSREHARIISKRDHLPNSVIEALALLDDPVAQARVTYGHVSKVADLAKAQQTNLKPVSADEARERLREIMGATFNKVGFEILPEEQHDRAHPRQHGSQDRLVKLALHDEEAVYATAVADLSGLPFAHVLKLVRRTSSGELATLLKALDIDSHAAFVMCAVFYPAIASSRSEIRLFLKRLANLGLEQAREIVRGWKASEISAVFHRGSANVQGAESHENITDEADLISRAS
jgi:uncharacterized protein (DUF2336 family)